MIDNNYIPEDAYVLVSQGIPINGREAIGG